MQKNEKSGEIFSRAGLSFLLSVGLTLPLVLVLPIQALWPAALLTCGATTAALSLFSLARRLRWFLLAGLILWLGADMLLAPGGGLLLSSAIQVGKALYLTLYGQPDAMPLYATEASILIACVFTVVSYFLCMRGAGFYPALGMILVVMMGVWFSGRQELLVCSLPALVALVVLYSRNINEDLPARRILPIAIVAVALAFLLLPAGRVASRPLEQFAEDVRRTIYDYLFFTEPRNVFSLSAEGYYPQGPTQLGGPATPSEHLVMTVETSKNTLLRGVIKDEYTGRVWRDTTGGRRYLYISPSWRALRDTLLDANLPNANLTRATTLLSPQTVKITMQAVSASTLFTPQRIKDLSTQNDMVVYFNNASELFITRDLKLDDTYTVEAALLQGGDPGLGTLVDAAQETPDANYAGIAESYNVLPGHLEQPIFDLALRITENYQTPYDKALAIKNHLSRYYRYTLDAEAPPSNIDFVSYFLLQGKEGYCTYFASAMTVLCRMVGIPARYVEGYLAQPNASGVARVTGLNAHAWTEVYFSGFGWLPFDATPPQQQENTPPEESPPPEPSPSPSPDPQNTPEPTPTTTPAPNENTPEPSNEPEEQPTPSPEPSIEPPPENPTDEPPPDKPFPWWLLLALVFAAAIYLRLRMTTPAFLARHAKTEKDAMNAYIGGVYNLLLLDKQRPVPAESPLAFAARLDKQNRYPHPLLPMAEALCLSQYSRHPVQQGDVAVAKETFDRLYQPWNAFKKLRFRIYRAFFRRKNKK